MTFHTIILKEEKVVPYYVQTLLCISSIITDQWPPNLLNFNPEPTWLSCVCLNHHRANKCTAVWLAADKDQQSY